MPSLRQLQFAFEQFAIHVVERHDAVVGRAFHLPVRQPATEAVALQLRGRDGALETEARELLRSLGAKRIATELRVEWNPRLQTAAGRADYRQKIISLNPRLVKHPEEIDRTLRHELAHILAQFRAGRRRISPHGPQWQQACCDLGITGEKLCHTLPFRRSVVRRVSSTVARIVGAISLAYARSNALSPVWPVAACITAESSMFVFD